MSMRYERWRGDAADPMERSLAQAVSVVRGQTLPDAARMARVRRRLLEPRNRHRRLTWSWAVVVMLLASPLVAARLYRKPEAERTRRTVPEQTPGPPRPSQATAPTRIVPVFENEPTPGAVSPPPAAAARPRGQHNSDHAALAAALRALHREHRPGAALSLLEPFNTKWRTSAIRSDAMAARAQALLALGRNAESLDTLDELSFDALDFPHLQAMRGVLRSQAGRHAHGAADLDAALARLPVGALHARTLFNRGVVAAQLGDWSTARTLFRRYVELYPQGGRAAEAASLLEDGSSSREAIEQAP